MAQMTPSKEFFDSVNFSTDTVYVSLHTSVESEKEVDNEYRQYSNVALDREIRDVKENLARIKRSKTLSKKYIKARRAALCYKLSKLEAESEVRAEIQRLLDLEQEWGQDYVAILFKRNFGVAEGRVYTYVAVRVDNGSWWITGRSASRGLSYEDLVNKYLVKAYRETGEVWKATDWEFVGALRT